MRINQENYVQRVLMGREAVAKALSTDAIKDLCKRTRDLDPSSQDPTKKWTLDHPLVKATSRALIKAQYDAIQELMKTNPPGLGTWLGFNFYDLRGPAYFLFPLLTPFIQMIPKRGKVNAGVGTVAHWKATRNPNSTYIYAGVQEGQRNATATPNEFDFLATYKELGMEGGNTFTSQWAGEGYTDNLADEHFRNLARLRLQEEMITLLGNSGTATGNLGFQMGQAPNITATLVSADTFNSPASAGFSSATNVSACVVAISGMGMNPGGQGGYNSPPTITNGLVPTSTRQNVDGTTLAVNGGTSQISNVNAYVTTNATAKWVQLTCAAVQGAVGYAWYISTGGVVAAAGNNTQGGCALAQITPWPKAVIGAAALGGAQLGNATGLSTDYSYQTTDFDGLLTYAFKNGYWNDMGGGTFTPVGNGQIAEVETDLQYLWNNYQAQPDAIWCSSDVRAELDQAVLYSSTGTNSFIFQYTRDSQGAILGGNMVTAYKSKYSVNPEGGAAIPIRLHPMLPQGTLYYDINTNPYPHSRVPAVREFMTQRDYYAIEWPIVTREWTYGTYIHEVLAHYMPWISAVRTGVGRFVAPCYLAAVAFDENFYTGPKTQAVRNYLLGWEQKSGLGKIVVGFYRLHGKAAAELAQKSSFAKRVLRSVFDRVLAKTEAAAK
jgi:hypothetical protein